MGYERGYNWYTCDFCGKMVEIDPFIDILTELKQKKWTIVSILERLDTFEMTHRGFRTQHYSPYKTNIEYELKCDICTRSDKIKKIRNKLNDNNQK